MSRNQKWSNENFPRSRFSIIYSFDDLCTDIVDRIVTIINLLTFQEQKQNFSKGSKNIVHVSMFSFADFNHLPDFHFGFIILHKSITQMYHVNELP